MRNSELNKDQNFHTNTQKKMPNQSEVSSNARREEKSDLESKKGESFGDVEGQQRARQDKKTCKLYRKLPANMQIRL